MTEKNSINDILLRTARMGVKFWRNNTGVGWVGKMKRVGKTIVLSEARPLHAGLAVGSGDIIGGTPIEITPAMVGRKILVFTSLEVKEFGVSVTKEQKNFAQAVRDAGGIGIVARATAHAESADVAVEALALEMQKLQN